MSIDNSTPIAPQVIHAQPVKHYGRWISALIVACIVLSIIDTLITNPNYQWDVVAQVLFMPIIFEAIGWTLLLTVCAMALGVTMAVTMAVMRRSENPVLRGVSTVYIWFFRGTPIYFLGTFNCPLPHLQLRNSFHIYQFFLFNLFRTHAA